MNGKRRETIDQKLADSFKKLAAHQAIDRITIKQITDEAGVIRPTFYNHFEDKYHLLAWILQHDLVEPVIPLMQKEQFREAMLRIFEKMQADRAFYMHAAKMEGQNSFREMIQEGLEESLRQVFEADLAGKQPDNPWLTPKHLAEFYAQGETYILLTWIESGMEIAPEKLMEVYDYVISRSLKEVLNNICNNSAGA